MDVQSTEMTAEFACSALQTLSRQIRDFCVAGPKRIQTIGAKYRAAEASRFVDNAVSLTDELELLIELAYEIRAMRAVNLEQMEAELERLRDGIELIAMSEMAIQN